MTQKDIPPVTRADVTNHLRHRLGLSAREAGIILDGFIEAISAQLAAGGVTTLSGLGRFSTRRTVPRIGRNPATGQQAPIPSRIRPVFTLSRTLRTMIMDSQKRNE